MKPSRQRVVIDQLGAGPVLPRPGSWAAVRMRVGPAQGCTVVRARQAKAGRRGAAGTGAWIRSMGSRTWGGPPAGLSRDAGWTSPGGRHVTTPPAPAHPVGAQPYK